MSTQYLNELVTASSCGYFAGPTGISTLSYFAFITGVNPGGGQVAPGVNNSGNLNLYWDLDISYRWTAAAASSGLYVYLVSSPSGGTPISNANSGAYEDGVPYFNDGAHSLLGDVTTPDSHNLVDVLSASDSGYHHTVIKDVAVQPYVIIPVVFNNDFPPVVVNMTVLGKVTQTIGP